MCQNHSFERPLSFVYNILQLKFVKKMENWFVNLKNLKIMEFLNSTVGIYSSHKGKFLVVVHGTQAEVDKAHAILDDTEHHEVNKH
jgi:hypothetical protein